MGILDRFRKRKSSPTGVPEEMDVVGSATNGEITPWLKGFRLTAVEPVQIRVPKAVFKDTQKLSDALLAHDDIGFSLPEDDPEAALIRLDAGQWAELNVSVQMQLYFENGNEGEIRIVGPNAPTRED